MVFSHVTFSLATLAAAMIEDKQLHSNHYNIMFCEETEASFDGVTPLCLSFIMAVVSVANKK